MVHWGGRVSAEVSVLVLMLAGGRSWCTFPFPPCNLYLDSLAFRWRCRVKSCPWLRLVVGCVGVVSCVLWAVVVLSWVGGKFCSGV